MNWHIDTDIVALIVIVALYIYSVRLLPQYEKSARDTRFLWCLRTGILVTVIDIAASVIMEVPTTRLLYHLLMSLYFVSIELVILAWLYYAIAILYQDDADRRRAVSIGSLVPFALYAILVVTNPWTGVIYTLGPDNAYTRGPFFSLMIVVFALYSLWLFLLILLRRKHIPAGYPSGVLLLIPLTLALSIAVQLLNPGWLMILPGFMICLVLAFLFLQTVRLRSDREQVRQLTELVEHFACGLAICRVEAGGTLTVQYLSNGLAEILETDSADLTAHYHENILFGVHPEDREMVKQNLDDLAQTLCDHEMTFRFLPASGGQKWINVKTRVTPYDGGTAMVYATYTDLTEQKNLQRQLSDLIHIVPCGICLYRWDGEDLIPLIANNRLSEMLGEDAMLYLKGVTHLNYSHVHPDDLASLRAASYLGLTQTHQTDTTYRTLNFRTNTYIWVRMRSTMLPEPDGTQLVYCSYYDVTQEHLAEQRIRESEQALEYATEQAGLRCWRYDAARDCAYPDAKGQQKYGMAPVMEHFLTEWLPRAQFDPEGAAAFRDACLRMKAGERQAVFEARSLAEDGELHWARYCLTNLFGDDGQPTIAVGTAMLIDAEKELWAKYELERNRRSIDSGNLLVHAVFNLTTGETLEYAYQDGTPVPEGERTAFTYGGQNAELLIDEDARAQFLALNDKETLLRRFAAGETEFRLEYRKRLGDGAIAWTRSVLHVVRDPETSDILLFEYWYLIDEEKLHELMYRSLASDSYDYVARIDGRTRSYVMFPKAGMTYRMPPLTGDDADKVTMTLFEEGVPPEDRELVVQNILVDNIRAHLQQQDRYQFTYREVQPDGDVLYKQITQYYLDPEREIILMTREDVTEVVRTEAKKNDILATALEAANQASRAKSQFLSRMSHELRTPMNAIIGLSALAAGEVGDPAAMENSIAKIGISARYLLSLINDILEMSRIESGRMTLNEGPFDFEQLLASISNIIYGQAAEKGLDYDAIVSGFPESSYIGDATKLQQVLINILGNAVKFTPAGGKVTLNVEPLRRSGDRATLRFTVSDTGTGIDKEFLPHLFEAFAQESASFTSTSTGTGLGLAIAKNMVDMMNGQINVQSIKGVGSVFTVEVQLRITEESLRHKELVSSMNLSNLHALVVDDDVIVCETTERILREMGLTAEWADSGARAVERVAECRAQARDFDTIFIDWKMPEMDGIETTRQIRKIVGPDVTIIIMTSYDWRAIEAPARAAGVDLFLDKPLLPSAIRQTFETLYSSRREPAPKPKKASFDFTGRHILLVEDHPLNVEVAKRLLERIGAQVTVANNGLEAIEAFTTAAPYFYDAILMDIRMPVMDGLTAAKNIRSLKKDGSKTVPIIAMTANAFDEDVELSLASGMNAHLTKPIEPQNLFSTLQRLMPSRP